MHRWQDAGKSTQQVECMWSTNSCVFFTPICKTIKQTLAIENVDYLSLSWHKMCGIQTIESGIVWDNNFHNFPWPTAQPTR